MWCFQPSYQDLSNIKQIFGFKYNLSSAQVALDPNEVANVRYRLFYRAIRINGLSQINMLLPHFQAKLENVVEEKIEPYTNVDGTINIVYVRYRV